VVCYVFGLPFVELYKIHGADPLDPCLFGARHVWHKDLGAELNFVQSSSHKQPHNWIKDIGFAI